MSRRSTSDRLDVRNDDVIGRRWKVLEKLGEGAFGLVLMVADLTTPGVIAAMKLEVNATDCPPLLKMEVDLMEKLAKVEGIRHVLKVLDRGKNDQFKWMAMDFAGDDLGKLLSKRPKNANGQRVFSQTTCLLVALQVIDALQGLHEVGYVHRDIKPENLVIDRVQRHLCLLDFGMARKFINSTTNQHHRARPTVAFRGTAQYASPWALLDEEQSRRDDLFAAILVLVEISTGRLPWKYDPGPNPAMARQARQDLAREKVQLYGQMFDGCEPEIKQVADKIYCLQYSDDPDYHGMKVIINSGLRRLDATGATLYDWEKPRRAPIPWD